MTSEVVPMRARLPAVFIGLAILTALVAIPIRAGAARAADPFDHVLRDVAAIAADDAWAVGDDLLVHWDGAAWTVAGPSILRAHTFRAVAARSATDVWVAGSLVVMDQNVPLLLHYDGSAWTRVHVPRHEGESALTDVVTAPHGVVWAVGSFDLYTPDTSRRGGLVYRFDGSAWSRIPVPGRVAALSAATVSGRSGLWAVGTIENPLDHPAALRWNGTAWRVDRLPEFERDTFAVDVVAQGPGNVGTGTPWGFSGAAAGEALNAAHVLGGHAVASLRVSEGDARPRHRGISHHSRTAYGRVALVPATVPVPRLDGAIGTLVAQQAQDLAAATGGRLALVEGAVDGLDAALRQAPVRLSTMGRGLDEDAAAFLAAAAAGRYAAGAGNR
jgi:hypothetical protein